MISLNMLNLFGIDKSVIVLLIVLALIISCIFSNIMRYVSVVIIFALLSISGLFATFYSYEYLTTKGAVYGTYEMGANNITKAVFDGKDTFIFSLLGFAPTSQDNIYECKVTFENTTLNLSKYNNTSLNGSYCNLQKQDVNAIQTTYSYAFLDEQYNELCSDTLTISLYTYSNSMQLRITTQSGDSGAKYWRKFMQKNGFSVQLTNASSMPKSDEKDTSDLKQAYTTWVETTWNVSNIDGGNVWSDGTNTYYSSGLNQYVLDKSTKTWLEVNWTGISEFNGYNVWNNGTNCYYIDDDSNCYVIDTQNYTLTPVDIKCFTDACDIWSDGQSYYYGSFALSTDGKYHGFVYKFNATTQKFELYTDNANFCPDGDNVFSDGTNTYYLDPDYVYELNKSYVRWDKISFKDANGDELDYKSLKLYGYNIWHFKDKIFYSNGTTQYEIDTSTKTFIDHTWQGFNNVIGDYIWTDGTNYYYSNGTAQYVLI